MAKPLKVYLAGPMTNCNDKQRTEWRLRIRRKIRVRGNQFTTLDPTSKDARKGALAVSADIEEADVVIANLWRESIGTVLGIVQAQRCGIPVIMIDQNYIDSPVLKSIVEHIVRDEDAAVNKLYNELLPVLDREITVIKKNGQSVRYDLRKLQNSLKAACEHASIDDPILHIIISKRAHREILNKAKGGSISTQEIKEAIFTALDNFCKGNEAGPDQQHIVAQAGLLKDQWNIHELLVKAPGRSLEDTETKLLREIEDLTGKLSECQLECENLHARLSVSGPDLLSAGMGEKPAKRPDLVESLSRQFNKRKALCVSMKGKSTFRQAFERHGISPDQFSEFFEELLLDGKQSNLNVDLKGYLSSYVYVLYAYEGLRHLSDPEIRSAANLLTGFGPSTTIRRFLDCVLSTC